MLIAPTGVASDHLDIPIDTGWRTEARGNWQTRTDHRDLRVMRHPWTPSADGDFMQAWRVVQVPADWQGPVTLSFYCSDDYHTDNWRPDGSWLTAEGFVGHRQKQVLVDGEPVWSMDVRDAVVPGASPRYRVTLDVTPGSSFVLMLVAFDTVGSATVLDDDFYQSANDETPREDDPGAANFMTHIYWGDLALVQGDAEAPAAELPSVALARARHRAEWPIPLFGGWTADTARLAVTAAGPLPDGGFPLTFGIPAPPGRVSEIEKIRLQSLRGNGVYAQKKILATWPDNSIRWIRVDTVAKPGVSAVDLAFATDWGKPPAVATWETNGMGVALSSPPVSYEAVLGAPLHAIRNGKTTVVEHLELAATAKGQTQAGTVHSVHVPEEGPFRAEIALEGTIGTEENHLAAFTLTVATWAGLPYLRLLYQIVNDTPVDLPLESLVLTLALPEGEHRFRAPGVETPVETLSLHQPSAETRRVNDAESDPTAAPWIAWDQGVIAVRRFRELFPKRIDANARRIRIDLAAAEGAPVVYTPGEAQTHEIWIALNGDDPAAFAAAVENPPVFGNPAYYCATGVLGPAYPHADAARFPERMAATYGGKSWEDLGQHLGLRHFPDSPYYDGLPNWSNNYYERMLGLWSEWFMTGDRAWYDRAVDVCRHLMDVSVTHSEVPGQDWRGGLRGPGANHVSAPWNPTQRTAGLALYHKLTGNPAAWDACLGVAEYVRRTGAGLGGSSVRQHAGPFDALVTAYWDTRDAVWRDEGRKHLADARAAMDPRRGVWPDMHGSQVYRGNVPWMDAQIARPLYWWYRMTGDLDAATALVAMADAIVCENTDWDAPGAVYGYSHNPHFEMTAVYDPLILPVIFAAHELTGDAFFLEAAVAQWRRWADSGVFDSVFNTYWNVPWLMHYLHVHGLMEGEAQDAG